MTSRRDFLKQAAASVAALSVGESVLLGADGLAVEKFGKRDTYPSGNASLASAPAQTSDPSSAAMPDSSPAVMPDPIGHPAASDMMRLGVVGVNARGKALARSFSKMPDCEIVALCDCDRDALARCQEAVREVTGKTPRGYEDYRLMLKDKDLDGIVIAMPDHWHAPAAIMALQAGKHVYLEKPTSHNPAENEMLLKVAARHRKCVITVGTQRRSWPNVVAAINEIRSGNLGEVRYAKSWYTAARTTIGKGKVVPVPDRLNWDSWQGPAPRGPEYRDNLIHYNWHWFWHWGTGEALNNGTHFVDMLRWGMGLKYPTKVTSVGGRYYYTDDDWECPDTQLITFQFGGGASFSWEGRSCNRTCVDGRRSGVAFYGNEGYTLYMDGRNSYQILDADGKVVKDVQSEVTVDNFNTINPSERLDMYHFRNWFDAIRTGAPLNATLEDGCISTQLMQLGNIAQRVGRSLEIDPFTGRIVGDPAAMQLWSREYDPDWAPKVF